MILKLALRRLAIGVLTLLIVSALIFWAVELLPGDIASEVLGQSATPETLAAFREAHKLHDPAMTRYLRWLAGALSGDLGLSLWCADLYGHPAATQAPLALSS